MPYNTMPTRKLIENYVWEKGRRNKEDMRMTQGLIKEELKRRFDEVFRFLDSNDDEVYSILYNMLGERPPEEWGMQPPSERVKTKEEQKENKKNYFSYLNGVSVSCVCDYTTSKGDSETFVRLNLPFDKDRWCSVIVPKNQVKDSKNEEYKDIQLVSDKMYCVMVSGMRNFLKGEEIVDNVNKQRKYFQDKQIKNAEYVGACMDEAFEDALVLDK